MGLLEASQAVIDCGQNELVLEDICRDSTAPDAWNLYATRDYTLKPHSLTRITVSGYQTRGDINVVLDGSKHLLFEKILLHRPWYPHIVTEKVMSGLPTCKKQAIRTTPEIFWAFTKTDKSTAAKTNVKHRIFTGDHAPINQRAYRVSPTERRIIHEEVQKMLDEGIVQPSESPWSSPIVLSLLKSGVEFHWGPEEVEAFNSLKKALTSDPVLGMYDERASTEIHTDASGYGIGAVLVQIQNNVEKVIAYASRTLTKAEKNYSTTERECLAIVWATNKFRPYIFGKHFTVVTDHHSLCWLMNSKDPSGRLARWALRLQEHDFDVKYKTGKKHSDADALSRNPVEEETETSDKFLAVTTSMNLAMEQKKDQDLAKLKLLSNSSKNEEFRFIDGILCRKNFDPDGKLWLPVIPKHLRADILRHFHDAPTAGHLGFAKTYDRIRKRFYWPGMYRNVVRYVMHCRECQRRKSVPQRPPGRLVPIPPAIAPFHRIGIDLLGRFPKHGAPRVIITDRGAVFRSRLVSSLVDLCNIDHRFTTAYHPQTNGLTERFNKTLADMLSMYVDVEQKNWDEILPFVTFAYNTAKQETTGFTPFYLLHGREAETTLDTMLPFCPNDFDDNNITKIAARAEESRQLARVHTLSSRQRSSTLRFQTPNGILRSRRSRMGFYSTVTYEVQDFDPASRKRKLREVVHVLRMKPYHDPAEQIETEDIPPKESYKGPITRSRIKTLKQNDSGALSSFSREQCRTHKSRYQVPIAELAERWTELPQVSDESRSFFRVHTGYFSNIPKCIKAEFIASWACSQSSVVSSSKR
ncbi:hypothetical protein TNCV_3961601 [Trichonephila clavipes]|nr:hypothetical protein TNCV_3961601 [Trichonephila clavipes]